MNELIAAAVTGLIRATVTEFTAWQAQRARDAAWKPSPQDVDAFMAQVAADSPEALKARVAASLGITWPPPPSN